MNLTELIIPTNYEEMIKTYHLYYHSFYLEMIRMSNANLNDYVNKFLDVVTQLAKSRGYQNAIRSSIGILALYRFGYNDFGKISQIFDCLLPQTDTESVKFTSWCAGQLIHHPNLEQSRYVSHLFTRLMQWARSKGRRARPLAAAYLFDALSTRAGSSAVCFLLQLQSTICQLASHTSTRVLKVTAKAIRTFTRTIIRYGRSDLEDYMTFLFHLSTQMLSLYDPIRKYAALLIIQSLIESYPDFFPSRFLMLFSLIQDACYDSPLLVQGEAYVVCASLSLVDSKMFLDSVADELFEKTEEVLLEFPVDVVNSLCLMCQKVPVYMEDRIDDMKQFVNQLTAEPNAAFILLTGIINSFGEKALPFDQEVISMLLKTPMTLEFRDFIVAAAKYPNVLPSNLLTERLIENLKGIDPSIAISIISDSSSNAFSDHILLFDALTILLSSPDIEIRITVPKAMFNIHKHCAPTISNDSFLTILLQEVMYDHSFYVRAGILGVLRDKCDRSFATPEFMKFFKIFSHDDSSSVRQISYQIIEKLSPYNPIAASSIMHTAILDAFFIIRNDSSIRTRSRIAKTLPFMMKATKKTLKTYTGGFMDIAMQVFEDHLEQKAFENFLEVSAYNSFLIGIIEAMSLIAPIDPDTISCKADFFIPILCSFLNPDTNRQLALSILNLLLVLLSPPASTLAYRAQTAQIIGSCSSFLAATHSRKVRIAILKVFGVTGVLEFHNRPPSKVCRKPENIDDSLVRQFFHPKKDIEGTLDDSLLLDSATSNQYYNAVVANSLLEIFKDESLKDFYTDAVHSLVLVLSHPKMYMLIYFDSFLARFLEVMETATTSLMKIYLPEFSSLILNSQQNTIPFLERSLKLIRDRFCTELASQFIGVINSFLTVIRDGFSPYASETICLLISCLDTAKTSNKDVSKMVMLAFSKLGIFANDLLYMIVPNVCDVVECKQALEPVRLFALETLEILNKHVDLFAFLGPIMRATTIGLNYPNGKLAKQSMNLFISILKAQGSSFLPHAQTVLDMICLNQMETDELRQVVKDIKSGVYSNHFTPQIKVDNKKQFVSRRAPQPSAHNHVFSEDAITERILTPNLGLGRQLEAWLRSFILAVISNSPSTPIRICSTLATAHFPLALKLFNSAFLSCWREIGERGRKQLIKSFHELILATEESGTIVHEIINLLVFMHKIEEPLDIPHNDLINASLQCGGSAFALLLQEKMLENKDAGNRTSSADVLKLIDIYIQLGNWPNAIGMWQKRKLNDSSFKDSDTLSKLGMWDQVMPIYEEKFNRMKDFDSFVGLVQSLASMAMWTKLMSYYDVFKRLKIHQKKQLATHFSEACLHLKDWESLSDILQYSPDDSSQCIALIALNALHQGDFEKAESYVEKGFSLIASRPITFWTENKTVRRNTMLDCQNLIEINEMKMWLRNQNRKNIVDVWNERLKTTPRDFDLWFSIISNRLSLIQIQDNNLIKLFQLKSVTLGTKMHLSAFDNLFPLFDFATAPDLYKVCCVVAHWYVGEKQRALEEMEELTVSVTGDLKQKCQFFYANWLLELDDSYESLKKAYAHLAKSITSKSTPLLNQAQLEKIETAPLLSDLVSPEKTSQTQLSPTTSTTKIHKQPTFTGLQYILPTQIIEELTTNIMSIEMLRKWSDVNVALASHNDSNLTLYVTNAIDALTQCATLSPSFPDVVLLLNLFFEHADINDVFNSTAHNSIEKIQPKLLLKASPQLLVQLSHPSKEVADFIHNIIYKLLLDHYHGLIFSLIIMTKSKNVNRAKAAQEILNEFLLAMPEVYNEVTLIRKTLLRVTVTWHEYVLQKIVDVFDFATSRQYDKMYSTLVSIQELSSPSKAKCLMHKQFQKKYGNHLTTLERLLNVFKPEDKNFMSQVTSWCQTVQSLLREDLNSIKMIQLSAVCPELYDKTHFYLAIPGTYRPNKPVIRIEYFVGQFSVYASKQQPKDVVIKGEDGNFYQYLLKGHEDLRLDERIMQFFRMINSFLRKEACFNANVIQIISVIPLSVAHGLVQWVPGTETMRNIIENQRKKHGFDPMLEYSLCDDYGCYYTPYDYLRPIQKMQLLERVFKETSDSDIADSFWLMAPSAEQWLKKIDTFSITTAITSAVGYIIGLGDRHPSNLLIDTVTGKVVHIDFGDCFEKAALRKYLPEVVPFRLTRMMVKAMGAVGVDGIFMTSFINMLNLLCENNRVLIMVLSIFVHEPLVDPEDQTAQEILLSKATTTGSIVDKGRVFIAESSLEKTVSSSVEMRKRVSQKLNGNDPDIGLHLNVEEQASRLIQAATDTYHLSKMYSGWCPFW